MFAIFLVSLCWLLLVIFLVVSFRLAILRKKIQGSERRIIALYLEKINKIPGLIEIIGKYTSFDDIFLELIHLHKIAIVSNTSSVYDILESNSRIHREFLFLMKVAVKIHNLHKDGNFLYIRDFIMFYENALAKEISNTNLDIQRYNSLRAKKKFTILGLFSRTWDKIPLSL